MIEHTCSIDDVSHSPGLLKKGMCAKHYQRVRKYGSPFGAATSVSCLCVVCGSSFDAGRKGAKYCSQRCKDVFAVDLAGATCAKCSTLMHPSGSFKQGVSMCFSCRSAQHGSTSQYGRGCRCVECCGAKRIANEQHKLRVRTEWGVNPSTLMRRRYRERTGKSYPQNNLWDWISYPARYWVYERDGWLCHLCGDPIVRGSDPNGDFAASLDHLVPRSKGGSDDVRNLKAAHRVCNSIRGVDALV